MKPIYKVVVEKLHFPIDNHYFYDVKILTSIDNGKSFWYGGNGKYARTLEEAEKFANQYKQRYC
jgi:hypothetical protein